MPTPGYSVTMAQNSIRTIDGETIDDLLAIIRAQYGESETGLIKRAYEYALDAHGDQKRKSGRYYIVHPLATAISLARLGMDVPTVAAGLLHDVPEDTDRTLEDLKKEFGEEIAFLVRGITKLGQLKYRGADRYVENLRRMFLAMAEDARVIVIKFADRMNNLRTLQSLPDEKRYRIALESLEIFAPIANRLGMGEIKGQIEDLAFPYTHPKEYTWIRETAGKTLKRKEAVTKRIKKYFEKSFGERGVEYVSIDGRTKHLYSLYKKMTSGERDISKIYDLVAVRIIVPSVAQCYETLGIVHELCKPLKGRIKDYIAQPKPNGYQSLHTTVFAPDQFSRDTVHGEIVEIQIRTPEMHEEAEYGIAAHWRYKEDMDTGKSSDARLKWMKQLVDLQQRVADESQLIETLKIDVFQNYIFVFTPRGDVIELPERSTPIDFAYKIHTELGNKCSAVKINGQIATLDTSLQNGDVVEIFTNPKRKGPSPDWLAFVKTSTAKQHIRNYLNSKRAAFVQRATGKSN